MSKAGRVEVTLVQPPTIRLMIPAIRETSVLGGWI